VWCKSREEADRMLAAMPADTRRRYDDLIAGLLRYGERMARDGLPPQAVAEVVERALTVRRPRARYIVGRDARTQAILARPLPDRALDAVIARALVAGSADDR
jgi:hypothetical protein